MGDSGTFVTQLHQTRSRAQSWRRRAGLGAEDDSELLAALAEFDSLMEELRTAEEELRTQGEQLASIDAALAAERERCRELFEQAPAVYLVTDASGLILDANQSAAKLLGVPLAELRDKPLAVFVANQDRQPFRQRLLHADGIDLREWELRLRRQGGAVLRAAVTIAVARDADGGVTQVRWLLRELPPEITSAGHRWGAELGLQLQILPRELPEVAGVELAARYLPSSAELAVGGDFYDVILLPGGRVGLVIGDVAGHGVRAATVVSQLRAGLRAYVLEGHGPAAVIERLSRLLEQLEPELIATCCYLVVDPADGLVCWSSAGHPPAYVVGLDGSTRCLEGGQVPPLGVPGGGPVEQCWGALEPGALLLLYTDGLVERHGESLEDGLALLEGALRRHHGQLEACCDRLLAELAAERPLEDDIAMLALRLCG